MFNLDITTILLCLKLHTLQTQTSKPFSYEKKLHLFWNWDKYLGGAYLQGHQSERSVGDDQPITNWHIRHHFEINQIVMQIEL